MRTLIRDHLIGLVPADELDEHIDLLRVLTNGIVLASVEHRDDWPAERRPRTPPLSAQAPRAASSPA